jgi:hypothetical protein
MRRHLFCLLLAVSAIPVANAQAQSRCAGRDGVPIDSLFAHARRLHPEVMKPENQSDFVIVALVYDNKCNVVRHAMKRVAKQADIGGALKAVFPDSTRLSVESFEISGFTALKASPTSDVSLSPVIAWGILTPRGISRF